MTTKKPATPVIGMTGLIVQFRDSLSTLVSDNFQNIFLGLPCGRRSFANFLISAVEISQSRPIFRPIILGFVSLQYRRTLSTDKPRAFAASSVVKNFSLPILIIAFILVLLLPLRDLSNQ